MSATTVPVASQGEDILHQVLQWRLGGNCVVHESRFEGVILVVADHTGGQRVVADQICDDTPCIPPHHSLMDLGVCAACTLWACITGVRLVQLVHLQTVCNQTVVVQ